MTLLPDRPLPHSPTAERATLSCLLQNPCLLTQIMARVSSMDVFFIPTHRRVYTNLVALAETMPPSDIDMVLLTERMEKTQTLDEVGGETFIMDLFNAPAGTHLFGGYLESIMEAYSRRTMITAANEISARLWDNDDMDTAVQDFEQTILQSCKGRAGTKITPISDVLEQAVREITNPMSNGGYSWGIPGLDDYFVGLKKGNLYVVAARPSVGKSALAHCIIRHFGLNTGPVGIISLEMDALAIAKRILAAEAKIDPVYFNTDRLDNLGRASLKLKGKPIFIEESATGNAAQLRSRARAMHMERKIKLLVIDYLQLFQGSGNKNNTRERDVAELSATAKALARELDIPVVALCQLKRTLGNDAPKLSHLRESGSIEQDADGVLLLHRKESPFDPVVLKRINEGGALEMEGHVGKNRNGKVGICPLFFYPKYTLFRSEEINYHVDF